MAFGLHCLVTNMNSVRAIGTAMRSMADTIIGANAKANVTARDLYNNLKKAGIDIDLESAAFIYADTFASDINNYSNFETSEQLAKYALKYPPVSKEVKEALISAGFKKLNKDGKEILDWTTLMRKTEDEIKQEIRDQNLKNEDKIFASLQNEYKQIVSTAIIKAKNDLSARNEPVSPQQKNAIDKLADLQVRGLFSDFQDTYSNAMSRAIGANASQIDAMNEIDRVGKAARMLQNAAGGTNNYLGQVFQGLVNNIISKARYQDSSWIYKVVKAIANLVEMANLSTLNNIANRGQNFFSGKIGRFNSSLTYGMAPKEIRNLASSTKTDSIQGGPDAGDVYNMFYGDRHATEKVREWINSLISKDGENRAVNWWYAQIMGTAALNGVDNFNKVKNTWIRFTSGLADILVSKGMTRKEAEKKLHEEIFGQKWQDARDKAEKIMVKMQQSGAPIRITSEAIDRFGADIVKAELINNKIFTEGELNAAWEAGYRSSGVEMGHVPNNPLSAMLQKSKDNYRESIEKALTERNYSKAAYEVLKDMLLNKLLMRFAGGGTNWIVLKLEKGGVGLFRGLVGKAVNVSAYKNAKSLSKLSDKEIEENIYERQRINDRLVRGTVGLTANTAMFLLAAAAFSGGGGEDRKKKVMKWLDSNKWVSKYINNWMPFFIAASLAYQQQKKAGGLSGVANNYGYSPLRSYMANVLNKNDDFDVWKGVLKGFSVASSDEDKKAEGYGELGKVFGNFFNTNPLPYKPIKDVYTVYMGMTGTLEPYKKPTSFPEGYLKFGMFDFPKHGDGAQIGFTPEDMQDPTFKYFLDKGLKLPSVSLSSVDITDEKNKTIKSVSEYPKDIRDLYESTHKRLLKEELADVISTDGVYVRSYKNAKGEDVTEVSLEEPDDVDFEVRELSKLNEKELAKVLSIAQKKATVKSKDEVFYNK